MVVTAEATTRQKVTVSCARKRCDLIMIWMVCSVRNDDEGESMLYYFAHEPKKQQNKRKKNKSTEIGTKCYAKLGAICDFGTAQQMARFWHKV